MKYVDNQIGFSLIEVVVAISIFSVGLLAVASMQMTSITGNLSARTATESVSYAQDMVEKLYSLEYDDPNLAVGSHPAAPIIMDNYYQYSWTVVEHAVLPADTYGVKTITLDVDYTKGIDNKQSRLVFLKSENSF